MITIGDRVREAIDYMSKGQIEYALTPACIALDLTAKKITGRTKSLKSDYKKFVSDFTWLISYMGLPGLVAKSIEVPFEHPDIEKNNDGFCRIEDIIYHAIRCELVHSTGPDTKIKWSDRIAIESDGPGSLTLSNKFPWGIIGAIVFCPANHNENIEETYWISMDGFKFFIQEVWGREDLALRVLKMNLNG